MRSLIMLGLGRADPDDPAAGLLPATTCEASRVRAAGSPAFVHAANLRLTRDSATATCSAKLWCSTG